MVHKRLEIFAIRLKEISKLENGRQNFYSGEFPTPYCQDRAAGKSRGSLREHAYAEGETSQAQPS